MSEELLESDVTTTSGQETSSLDFTKVAKELLETRTVSRFSLSLLIEALEDQTRQRESYVSYELIRSQATFRSAAKSSGEGEEHQKPIESSVVDMVLHLIHQETGAQRLGVQLAENGVEGEETAAGLEEEVVGCLWEVVQRILLLFMLIALWWQKQQGKG